MTAKFHAIFFQFFGFCYSCTNSAPKKFFGGKQVREGEVFNSLWETLWKVRKIKGIPRVFHRENLFFLWKTFLFPLENFCGICPFIEKQQNAKNILTAKNASFYANSSFPDGFPWEIRDKRRNDAKKATRPFPLPDPGVVNRAEGINVSANIVYVMWGQLFTQHSTQNLGEFSAREILGHLPAVLNFLANYMQVH